MRGAPFAVLLTFLAVDAAADSLVYWEAQGVAGYSSAAHKIIYRSNTAHDAMQKNSFGIDALHRFDNATGDRLSAALQMRVAYNDDSDGDAVEMQIYNAYLKYKTNGGDVWLGHNRPAFGLSSYWDTHADLIGALPMYGFGYDRDWGGGYSLDTENGNVSASLTSGTGMNYRAYGNYLAAARASYGVLNRDNYTTGLSFVYGKPLETMGNHIEPKHKNRTVAVGLDGAFNMDRTAHKAELAVGTSAHEPLYAALYRFSLGLDEEERLFYEFQPTYVKKKHAETVTFSNGVSYVLTGDLTARLAYRYQPSPGDNVYLAQLYWYAPF
jgi:hypothetical protein